MGIWRVVAPRPAAMDCAEVYYNGPKYKAGYSPISAGRPTRRRSVPSGIRTASGPVGPTAHGMLGSGSARVPPTSSSRSNNQRWAGSDSRVAANQ